jgi:hypothetical protein
VKPEQCDDKTIIQNYGHGGTGHSLGWGNGLIAAIDEFTGHFLDAWKGQPADGLFELMSTSMPVDEPGSLSRAQHADLLAFILKSNGFAAA